MAATMTPTTTADQMMVTAVSKPGRCSGLHQSNGDIIVPSYGDACLGQSQTGKHQLKRRSRSMIKRLAVIGVSMSIAAFLAACGSSTTPGTGSGGGIYGAAPPAAAPSTTAS